MGIGEDRIHIGAPLDCEIPYKSMVDLEEKKNQVLITAGPDAEETYRIASVEKVPLGLKEVSSSPSAAPTG